MGDYRRSREPPYESHVHDLYDRGGYRGAGTGGEGVREMKCRDLKIFLLSLFLASQALSVFALPLSSSDLEIILQAVRNTQVELENTILRLQEVQEAQVLVLKNQESSALWMETHNETHKKQAEDSAKQEEASKQLVKDSLTLLSDLKNLSRRIVVSEVCGYVGLTLGVTAIIIALLT
jgi:hypothetical protein